MATGTASKKCVAAAFSVMMFLLFFGGETLKLGSEDVVVDEYDPRKHAVDDPEEVVRMFEMATRNSTQRRNLRRHHRNNKTVNPIDRCWRGRHWRRRRKRLADCALGFGRKAMGGRNGKFYYVTSNQDDPVNPKPGSLRFAVIQVEPLWIVFKRNMKIRLKQELMINSFKTVDGRGKMVIVEKGAGLTLQNVHHVIIIGLTIINITSTGNAMVRDSPTHYGWRTMADGDGISLFSARHIWIDHNTISRCADGLVDAIMGSTAITISNNLFYHHNEVMLLGHSDAYTPDKTMQVTIAFNHFGEGLIQRMPRCRHGYFHVVNNDYTHWEMYALGGSADPTINSQGNRFLAPDDRFAKEVTKRVYSNELEWSKWKWRSKGDLFLNGAFFTPSGTQNPKAYSRATSIKAKPSSMVGSLTINAGNIYCGKKRRC